NRFAAGHIARLRESGVKIKSLNPFSCNGRRITVNIFNINIDVRQICAEPPTGMGMSRVKDAFALSLSANTIVAKSNVPKFKTFVTTQAGKLF
ncbi:MAG: hypothetical protein LBR08_00610, partial [Bacteroidales bacterium]|nr:hypothetical protein [Bacteroidales bacterium]